MASGVMIEPGLLPDASWSLAGRVQAGWERLPSEARARAVERIRAVAALDGLPGALSETDRAARRRVLSFLANLEVIGIEVPMQALGRDRPDEARTRMLLKQLEDEVVHCGVFAHLAARHGGLDAPVATVTDMLQLTTQEEDPRVAALLLNLLGEGWIETLLEQIAGWDLAPRAMAAVLADEERHHEEAWDHMSSLDPKRAEAAIRRFERAVVAIASDPAVALPLLRVGGDQAMVALMVAFVAAHKEALDDLGLEPSQELLDLESAFIGQDWDAVLAPEARPRRVAPASAWRRSAFRVWDTPVSPVMQGWTEVRLDHIPRKLITPVAIAVIGEVWRAYPRVNRFAHHGDVYEPSGINVGVRVGVGDSGEALGTVVVTDADKRSVRDIVRILTAGVARLNETEALGQEAMDSQMQAVVASAPVADLSTSMGDSAALMESELDRVLADEELVRMLPPDTVAAPVTFTNVGRTGLYAGFGAMPGKLGQSIEVVMGRIEKKPVWRGWRYKPTDVATIAFNADHRVVDGNHVGHGMQVFEKAMGREGVKRVLARPDTLATIDDEHIGTTNDQAAVMAALPPALVAGLTAGGGLSLDQIVTTTIAKCPWWFLPWKCKK